MPTIDYGRSRPGTLRSLSPTGQTPHGQPRAPSPCRILTKPRPAFRQQIFPRQPSPEAGRHLVHTPYYQAPTLTQSGSRISVAQVRPVSPHGAHGAHLVGSQSNASTISSLHAMSVRSGTQVSTSLGAANITSLTRPQGGNSSGFLQNANIQKSFGSPSSPTSPTTLPPNAELCEGAVLSMNGNTCRVKKPLGMGSFGAVWEAEAWTGRLPCCQVNTLLF